MAKAVCVIQHGLNRQQEDEFVLRLSIAYFGTDVDNTAEIQGPHDYFTNPLQTSNSIIQIENQIRDEVIAHALTKGLVVANGNILGNGLKYI